MTTTEVEIEAIVTLTARRVIGKTDEDDGQLSFWVEDGGGVAVELTHEIGDPEAAAVALLQLADGLRAHAERIRYRHRLRAAGWT